jgi:hypothetical protein
MKSTTLVKPNFSVVALAISAAAAIVLFSAMALLARADSAPSINQSVQNSGNNAVTTAPIGTNIHTVATVGSTTSATAPTGTVDFSVYTNQTCSGTPAVQHNVALVNGIASSGATALSANGLSFAVHYDGTSGISEATSSCASVAPTSASVTLTSSLSSTSIKAGTSVFQTASLSGATGAATGTVAYNVYTNNTCTNATSSAGTKVVTNAIVPNSDSVTFNTTGTFYFKAAYSGDQYNSAASGACQAVVVNATSSGPVVPPPTTGSGTISGKVFNDLNKNDTWDTNEPGLAGYTVVLHMGKNYNGKKIQTTVTDANGNYTFANLVNGKYFVEEKTQPKYKQTSDDMKVALSSTTPSATVNFANVEKKNNGNHWGWFKNWFTNGKEHGKNK